MDELEELEKWATTTSKFLEDHLDSCERCYYGILYGQHDLCRVGTVVVAAADAAYDAVTAHPDWLPF
jgi:hypothetical protein